MARNFKEMKTELEQNGQGVVVILMGRLAQDVFEYVGILNYALLLAIVMYCSTLTMVYICVDNEFC